MTQQRIPTESEVKAILLQQLNNGEITQEDAAQKMSNYRKMVSGQQVTQPVGMPNKQYQQQPGAQDQQSIGQRVLGDVQAVGRVAGGAIAEPLAGLAGMTVGAITQDAEQAAGAVEAVRDFAQVIPLNQTGQKRIDQFGHIVQKGVDAARFPLSGLAGIVSSVIPGGMTGADAVKMVQEQGFSDFLGDAVLNATESPELATIAYTMPAATLEAMGIKGARQLKGQTFAGAENAILSTDTGKALQQASPTIQQLKTQSRELYDAVDASGVKVDQGDYLQFALELNQTLQKNGFNPKVADKLSPKAQAVLQAIEDGVGDDFSFGQFDDMRKLANAGSLDLNNPLEQSLALIIKDSMDDFIDSQAAKLTGDASEVGKQLTQARQLWSRAKKAETIDEVIANASHQASGFENGLRIGFRQLLKNKKKLKGFSTEERALMQEIVDGTGVANTLKRVGKLGFGEGQQTNMLLGYLGGAGGYAVGGPFGAVVLPGIGTVSGRLATRLTSGKSQFLSDVTKAGGDGKQVVSAYMKNTPTKDRNITELTELLLQSNADLSAIKKGPVSQLVQDAVYAAEHLSNVGMTNFIAAPAFIEAVDRSQREEE